ncbi:MAG TPA: Smr/MutS family protein [Polyangia bacterium]|jgi:DNA-nicking Smr family endonuclease
MSPTGRGGDGGGRPSDDDDDHAFAEAMRGARPLARGHERVTGASAAAAPRRTRAAVAALSPFVVEQDGDAIAGRARDVALKLLHELRCGTHAIEARLDLHGRGRQRALRDLERFVAGASTRGARCLLVIHGRGHGSDAGGPVLRPAIWEWLASGAAARGGVMAFVSARPADGGGGATLVFLRRPA